MSRLISITLASLVLFAGLSIATATRGTPPPKLYVANAAGNDDRIWLDNAAFRALVNGALPAGSFHLGTSAADGDDYILYDQATGILRYDADGTGMIAGPVQFSGASRDGPGPRGRGT